MLCHLLKVQTGRKDEFNFSTLLTELLNLWNCATVTLNINDRKELKVKRKVSSILTSLANQRSRTSVIQSVDFSGDV